MRLKRLASALAVAAAFAIVGAQVVFPHAWWLQLVLIGWTGAAVCFALLVARPAAAAQVRSLRIYGDVRRFRVAPGDSVVCWTDQKLDPGGVKQAARQVRAALGLDESNGVLILGPGQEIGVLQDPSGFAARFEDHLKWAATHNHPHDHPAKETP